MHLTPWATIWSRVLRSANAVARHNALAATRVLHGRRIEGYLEPPGVRR